MGPQAVLKSLNPFSSYLCSGNVLPPPQRTAAFSPPELHLSSVLDFQASVLPIAPTRPGGAVTPMFPQTDSPGPSVQRPCEAQILKGQLLTCVGEQWTGSGGFSFPSWAKSAVESPRRLEYDFGLGNPVLRLLVDIYSILSDLLEMAS